MIALVNIFKNKEKNLEPPPDAKDVVGGWILWDCVMRFEPVGLRL